MAVTDGAGGNGVGDRGAFNGLPFYTGNPYTTNDFVSRWRQYVMLYETSWEARKIIRIVPEDALRKDWVVNNIDDDIKDQIQAKLTRLNFQNVLKRSLMLERLLGGCLTFMGLESDEDEPSKTYHPKEGADIKFCNAIPLSRISRTNWDTNPLSEGYMRPDSFLVNGETVHTSRCLVWDGEPLFDPYDYALTNFRSNLAGFGPSKLAPIWDDIIKAVGTRQAAYQMIQTNNALLVAVNALQDLQGTKPGKEALSKIKEIANSISLYRAALIDGDNVDIKQHSASFGSVPELVMTFIQIISAASDIPATRFIGQAPGGLNSTGESDLENYYNVIDAYQRQRIEPQLRRIYDVIGFNIAPEAWKQERDKLEFEFPPLWNASELEEAQKNSQNIDNVMKLSEAGLISDEKAIDEINSKGALSVELDSEDLGLLDDANEAVETSDPQHHLNRLRNTIQVPAKYETIKTMEGFHKVVSSLGMDPDQIDMIQFGKGFGVEMEHAETVSDDETVIAKIVLDHLAEDPQYYDKLEKVENSGKRKTVCVDFDGVIADYSKGFQGPTIFGDPIPGAKEALAKIKSQGADIIIFTCRENTLDLREYLRVNQIPYDSINSNPDQPENTNEGKPVADAYIDDKAVAFQGDWEETKADLRELIQNTIKEFAPSIRLYPAEGEVESFDLHGLHINIENPKGSMRSGKDPEHPWTSIIPAHYGYIQKTEGADGDEVDVYVGDQPDSELVFIVDQCDAETKEFDEHKCIFGCLSVAQATELYSSGFGDGKGSDRLMTISPVHVNQFRDWLKSGDTKKPFGGSNNG